MVNRAKGKDVSYWNGPNQQYPNVDWSQAIASCSLSFVFVRACYAHYEDPTFQFHWNGLGYRNVYRSAFVYLHSGYPIIPQVNKLVELMDGGNDMEGVLDCEEKGLTPGMVTAAKIQYEVLTGKKAIIYTGPWWWDSHMGTLGWENEHDLWVANYYAQEPSIPKAWQTWKFWQDSTVESCYGFDDPTTDRDWFNGTVGDLIDYVNGTPPPPPEPGIEPLYRGKVLADVLNIRSRPDVNSNDLGDLIKNSVVPVVEEDGDWRRIDGWVHKDYLQKL